MFNRLSTEGDLMIEKRHSALVLFVSYFCHVWNFQSIDNQRRCTVDPLLRRPQQTGSFPANRHFRVLDSISSPTHLIANISANVSANISPTRVLPSVSSVVHITLTVTISKLPCVPGVRYHTQLVTFTGWWHLESLWSSRRNRDRVPGCMWYVFLPSREVL